MKVYRPTVFWGAHEYIAFEGTVSLLKNRFSLVDRRNPNLDLWIFLFVFCFALNSEIVFSLDPVTYQFDLLCPLVGCVAIASISTCYRVIYLNV